jgi:hypothetical protein
MGMTDLQFKAFIKLLLRQLEDAQEKNDVELTKKEMGKILSDLREMLQG